jgi:hypothetical protein
MPTSPWSRDEVELIVADYFAMLAAELRGDDVNKADHNRRLRARLNNRSKGSVEFKHANISAVLLNLGNVPPIDGYKPRGNYQQLLEQVVLEWLADDPDFFERAAVAPAVRPSEAPDTEFKDVEELIEEPPAPMAPAGIQVATPRLEAGLCAARKVAFARVDAENRRLGRLGEEWAIEFERRRLHDVERRPDLAKQIVWVADAEGDGAGYDIRSFDRDASQRLIEVKTTGLSKYSPFYVTSNEVRVSERDPLAYHLYRVFRFAKAPKMFTLNGALSKVCRLAPRVFEARVGS